MNAHFISVSHFRNSLVVIMMIDPHFRQILHVDNVTPYYLALAFSELMKIFYIPGDAITVLDGTYCDQPDVTIMMMKSLLFARFAIIPVWPPTFLKSSGSISSLVCDILLDGPLIVSTHSPSTLLSSMVSLTIKR